VQNLLSQCLERSQETKKDSQYKKKLRKKNNFSSREDTKLYKQKAETRNNLLHSLRQCSFLNTGEITRGPQSTSKETPNQPWKRSERERERFRTRNNEKANNILGKRIPFYLLGATGLK
jgi:hypothetical protein